MVKQKVLKLLVWFQSFQINLLKLKHTVNACIKIAAALAVPFLEICLLVEISIPRAACVLILFRSEGPKFDHITPPIISSSLVGAPTETALMKMDFLSGR